MSSAFETADFSRFAAFFLPGQAAQPGAWGVKGQPRPGGGGREVREGPRGGQANGKEVAARGRGEGALLASRLAASFPGLDSPAAWLAATWLWPWHVTPLPRGGGRGLGGGGLHSARCLRLAGHSAGRAGQGGRPCPRWVTCPGLPLTTGVRSGGMGGAMARSPGMRV